MLEFDAWSATRRSRTGSGGVSGWFFARFRLVGVWCWRVENLEGLLILSACTFGPAHKSRSTNKRVQPPVGCAAADRYPKCSLRRAPHRCEARQKGLKPTSLSSLTQLETRSKIG